MIVGSLKHLSLLATGRAPGPLLGTMYDPLALSLSLSPHTAILFSPHLVVRRNSTNALLRQVVRQTKQSIAAEPSTRREVWSEDSKFPENESQALGGRMQPFISSECRVTDLGQHLHSCYGLKGGVTWPPSLKACRMSFRRRLQREMMFCKACAERSSPSWHCREEYSSPEATW